MVDTPQPPSFRDRVPRYPTYNLQPSDVERFFLYQLDETHNSDQRGNPLPQGALATNQRIYLVSNREEGSGINQRIRESSCIRGNPIDIMGGFMQDGKFFAFNNQGFSKIHWYQHRHLSPLEEGREYEFRVDRMVRLTYQNGVLVINQDPIKISDAKPISYLDHLRQKDSFHHAAERLLGDKRATNLADHLF